LSPATPAASQGARPPAVAPPQTANDEDAGDNAATENGPGETDGPETGEAQPTTAPAAPSPPAYDAPDIQADAGDQPETAGDGGSGFPWWKIGWIVAGLGVAGLVALLALAGVRASRRGW
jgi:hypothetical protein